MRPANLWLTQLVQEHINHAPACICKRCKEGHELFLTPTEVKRIQADALLSAMQNRPETVKETYWKLMDEIGNEDVRRPVNP